MSGERVARGLSAERFKLIGALAPPGVRPSRLRRKSLRLLPSVPSVSSVVAPRAPDTAEVARRFQGCQDPAMIASAVLPGT